MKIIEVYQNYRPKSASEASMMAEISIHAGVPPFGMEPDLEAIKQSLEHFRDNLPRRSVAAPHLMFDFTIADHERNVLRVWKNTQNREAFAAIIIKEQ